MSDSSIARLSNPEHSPERISPRLREVPRVIDERTPLRHPTHTDATPRTQGTGHREYWEACFEGFKRCFRSSCLEETTTQDPSASAIQDTLGDTISTEPHRTRSMSPFQSSSESRKAEGGPTTQKYEQETQDRSITEICKEYKRIISKEEKYKTKEEMEYDEGEIEDLTKDLSTKAQRKVWKKWIQQRVPNEWKGEAINNMKDSLSYRAQFDTENESEGENEEYKRIISKEEKYKTKEEMEYDEGEIDDLTKDLSIKAQSEMWKKWIQQRVPNEWKEEAINNMKDTLSHRAVLITEKRKKKATRPSIFSKIKATEPPSEEEEWGVYG